MTGVGDGGIGTSSPTPDSLSGSRRTRRRQANLPARCRLLFVGPVGAGKTTAVRTLSDVAAVDTDVPIWAGSTEYGDTIKTTTTVGLDYGAWKPTPRISVALVGTPGQDRFTHARAYTALPDTRILLWLRGDSTEILAEAAEWLLSFAGQEHHVVIAVSHCDPGSIDTARRTLAPLLRAHRIPLSRVLAADARDRDSVMRVACEALDLPEDER